MIFFGIGTDIVEVERIEKSINRTEKFLEKVFTQREVDYCNSKPNRYERYAGRFCAKEAVSKALGTGVRNFKLTDMEILNDELGKPIIYFNGQLGNLEKEYEIHLSISHCKDYATATAIIFKK
jgi:holo-[acyl-carrier protein] synthase